MKRIRVLVVDDSTVIRRLLTDVLSEDPEIELVGTAPNGRIALAKLPQLNPDLVTLDMEMPELDGLGTLRELRKSYPKLPVIMFSTLTQRGATSTLDALAQGATDYVTKPANVGSVTAAVQNVRQQLLPRIKALFPRPEEATAARPPAPIRPAAALRFAKSAGPVRCDAIVIGSSTGGPQALATVISKLPATLPVPILIAQHMPPVFTHHLACRLTQEGNIPVREAIDGEIVKPGAAWVAPGNFHLEVRRDGAVVRTVLHQGPAENSCRPAVDVLFRSAAAAYGKNCLAVVLTGMGRDGLRGAEEIAAVGGTVLAQDEATSVVWGMPRAVAEAGLARRILPLSSIAEELTQYAAVGRRVMQPC